MKILYICLLGLLIAINASTQVQERQGPIGGGIGTALSGGVTIGGFTGGILLSPSSTPPPSNEPTPSPSALPTPSPSPPYQPVCGNGIVDPAEECDGGACCSASCTLFIANTLCAFSAGLPCNPDAVCDGYSPECPSNINVPACNLCGNGVLDAGEQCDTPEAMRCFNLAVLGVLVTGSRTRPDPFCNGATCNFTLALSLIAEDQPAPYDVYKSLYDVALLVDPTGETVLHESGAMSVVPGSPPYSQTSCTDTAGLLMADSSIADVFTVVIDIELNGTRFSTLCYYQKQSPLDTCSDFWAALRAAQPKYPLLRISWTVDLTSLLNTTFGSSFAAIYQLEVRSPLTAFALTGHNVVYEEIKPEWDLFYSYTECKHTAESCCGADCRLEACSPSQTPSGSVSPSSFPSSSGSATPTPTSSQTSSPMPTAQPTAPPTVPPSESYTPSTSQLPSESPTQTSMPTASQTSTYSAPPTGTRTPAASVTSSPQPTQCKSNCVMSEQWWRKNLDAPEFAETASLRICNVSFADILAKKPCPLAAQLCNLAQEYATATLNLLRGTCNPPFPLAPGPYPVSFPATYAEATAILFNTSNCVYIKNNKKLCGRVDNQLTPLLRDYNGGRTVRQGGPATCSRHGENDDSFDTAPLAETTQSSMSQTGKIILIVVLVIAGGVIAFLVGIFVFYAVRPPKRHHHHKHSKN
jgi:hypothetical protein